MSPVQRIRRSRPVVVVESTPPRVRRVRSLPPPATPPVVGVKRQRKPSAYLGAEGLLPEFVIDWSRPLSYKLSIYMVTSFLYYELSRSLISDHDFDRLCKELGEGWDTFEHQHKHCTDRASMIAGTGYANEYPLMVQNAATHMMNNFRER